MQYPRFLTNRPNVLKKTLQLWVRQTTKYYTWVNDLEPESSSTWKTLDSIWKLIQIGIAIQTETAVLSLCVRWTLLLKIITISSTHNTFTAVHTGFLRGSCFFMCGVRMLSGRSTTVRLNTRHEPVESACNRRPLVVAAPHWNPERSCWKQNISQTIYITLATEQKSQRRGYCNWWPSLMSI